MEENHNAINRRNFLKTIGAAGLGSVFASSQLKAAPNEPNTAKTQESRSPQVPKRKLGKTGIEVSCLALGAIANPLENQTMLKKALEWGITYWDSGDSYEGGNHELGLGKYISNNPEKRKEMFIVTKAYGTQTTEDLERHLKASLKKLNTDYVDLYFIMERTRNDHGLSDPSQLDDGLKQWAEDAKKRKMIRFFGFCTHKNMENCLAAAAKLGWIDAIMTSYNVALMQNPQMQDAVQACNEAGIGLIAMKVLLGVQKKQAEAEDKMVTYFLDKGYTREQALIKAVLEDKRIATACIRMENVTLLRSNVAAVLDKTSLSRADSDVLKRYAVESCSGYCAGCADICNAALPDLPYTSEIMRYLMYYNSYGDKQKARELFAQIPGNVRNRLLSTDYSLAEARCPQRMPIGKLVAEAVGKLA